MITFLVEIGGYEQLKKVKTRELFKNLDELKKIFFSLQNCSLFEEEGYFLFGYKDESKVISKFNLLIDRLEKFFEIKRLEMQGNLVYIDFTTSVDMRSIFNATKKELIVLKKDRGFVYSNAFKENFPSLCISETATNNEKSLYGMSIIEKRRLLQNATSYALYVTKNILSSSEVISILERTFYSQPFFENIEFDKDSFFTFKVDGIKIAQLKKAIGFQSTYLNKIFTDEIYNFFLNGLSFSKLDESKNFFTYCGEGQNRLAGILYIAKILTLRYDLQSLNDFFNQFLSSDNSNESEENLELAKLLFHHNIAICSCDTIELKSNFEKLLKTKRSNLFFLEIERNIALSEGALTFNDFDSGLKFAKEVLLLSNESKAAIYFSSIANYLLALAMMQSSRVSEADLYFRFAFEESSKMGFSFLQILASTSRALISFFNGALDEAYHHLEISSNCITSKKEFANYYLYLNLFLGRLKFEEGQYEESSKIFESLSFFCSENFFSNFTSVIDLWKGRSLLFSKKKMKGISVLEECRDGVEKSLYLAEGYYLVGNFKKALSSIKAASATIKNEEREIFPYLNFKQSSFINFEDRAIFYDAVGTTLNFYHLAILVLIESAAKLDTHFEEFKKIVRNDLVQKGDPNARIYCYLLACASWNLDPNKSELDQLTLVNRAYKYLQEYIGATHEPEIRMGFVENNLWNKEIMNMAKRFKLFIA